MILKIAGPTIKETYQNPQKDKDIDWKDSKTMSTLENIRRKGSLASTVGLGSSAGALGYQVSRGAKLFGKNIKKPLGKGKSALIGAGVGALGLGQGHALDRLGHKRVRTHTGKSVNKEIDRLKSKGSLNDQEKKIQGELTSFRRNNPNLFR